MNNLNDEGVFTMNDEILPEVRSIAVLNGWDYGRGVYTARAMMDTVIEFNMPEEGEKVGIPVSQQIMIYPNPAKDFVTLKYFNGDPVASIQSVEICNLLGDVVKDVYSTTNILDISSISNGMYLIKVTLLQGEEFITKLEILK